MENVLPFAGGHFRQVHVLVHVVLFSASARLAGPGDAFDHRKPVLRRQVAVAGRHGDRLVPRGLLNLLNRRSGHCQPRAEGVTVRVPNVSVKCLSMAFAWRSFSQQPAPATLRSLRHRQLSAQTASQLWLKRHRGCACHLPIDAPTRAEAPPILPECGPPPAAASE